MPEFRVNPPERPLPLPVSASVPQPPLTSWWPEEEVIVPEIVAELTLLTTREFETTTIGWATVTPELRNSRPPVVVLMVSRNSVLAGSPRQPSAVMPRMPWNRLMLPVNELPVFVRL